MWDQECGSEGTVSNAVRRLTSQWGLPKTNDQIMKPETIMGFLRIELENIGEFRGLSFDMKRYSLLHQPEMLWGRPREDAENDPSFLQIIPYTLIVCGNKILRYRRGKHGDESRLHSKLSIGIGGHINDGDVDYEAGVRREMLEEIGFDWWAPPVACINDDSNPVGKVHFGFVHIDRVFDEGVVARCASIVDPQFISIKQAVRDRDQYESWSQICLDHIQQLVKL